MGFHAERVKEHPCPACQQTVDTAAARPLSTIPCPNCGRPMTVPARVGAILITRRLGEGAGSCVYAARDNILNREVALKVMKHRGEDDPGTQSALDEARALLLIDHPNVVKVYAIDTRRGQPCIIMERLHGGSLQDLIDTGQPLPEPRALRIAIDLARALDATSASGLLHLDVKPANVMFDNVGTAKLLDFGFAAVGIQDPANEIIGTPYYVAPELVRQESPDLRADIYSLGATLFHALAARPPFDGPTLRDIIRARLDQAAPDLRDLRPDLHEKTAAVIARMLNAEKTQRYRQYTPLLRDLEEALAAAESAENPA